MKFAALSMLAGIILIGATVYFAYQSITVHYYGAELSYAEYQSFTANGKFVSCTPTDTFPLFNIVNEHACFDTVAEAEQFAAAMES